VQAVSAKDTLLLRLGLALIAFVLLAAGAALLSPLLTYPFGRDQGVFATAADIISRGGVPYRDVWDVKPPGVFYAYWASFAIFGRSTPAPRALDILWTLATAAAIYSLGRRLASQWVGAAAAFLFVLRYVAGYSYWNTTQADGFASLPLCLAMLMLIRAEERKHYWLALACGACIALAVLFKLTLGALLVIPVLAALLSKQESFRARSARAVCYLLGCAGVLAVVAAALWRAGALGDALDVMRWNAGYSHLRSPEPLASSLLTQTVRFLLGLPHKWLFFIGLLAIIGAVDLGARPDSARMRWLLPAWAGVLIASVWAQGKFYSYHWLPALPPLSLLAAQGLRAIGGVLRDAMSPKAARALSAAGLLMVLALSVQAYWQALNWPLRYLAGRMSCSAFEQRYDRYGDFSLLADKQVAAFVRDRTAPDDTIFIWGFEPLIYCYADRRPASRFIYTVPLVTDWSPPKWRQELMRDLERNPPRSIIVVHRDVLPWMTNRYDDSAAQLAGFPTLEQLLATDYQEVGRIEDFAIFSPRERHSER
jgi:4-amino-4-deoxy-L-arabinose transferase-like glycosyltransferase